MKSIQEKRYDNEKKYNKTENPLPRRIYTEADFKRNFAVWIRGHKRRSRMTKSNIAHNVGISTRAIDQYLAGKIMPKREQVMKLGEFFNEPEIALLAAGYVPWPGWESRGEA